jgi:hypothetical protein
LHAPLVQNGDAAFIGDVIDTRAHQRSHAKCHLDVLCIATRQPEGGNDYLFSANAFERSLTLRHPGTFSSS